MDPSTSLRFAQGSLAKAIDPGSLSVVEATLRQLDYMYDDVTGSLSAVEVCLIFPTCMKKWTLRLHCVSLRDPGRKLCGRLTERSRSVPMFSTCMKKWTLRRCSGILGLAYGPFDIAQGSWAKAIASADAFHPVTFATKKTLKTYLHNRRFIL